jgi:hypothetical protein
MQIANVSSRIRLAIVLAVLSGSMTAQTRVHESPTLRDTLEWLTGTSIEESGDGSEYIEFESHGCQAKITEHRVHANPQFLIWTEFNFGDLDPTDFSLVDLGKTFPNVTSVKFHTLNYVAKMKNSDSRNTTPTPTAWYEFDTDSSFAPRFARAMKNAAKLCGARRPSF